MTTKIKNKNTFEHLDKILRYDLCMYVTIFNFSCKGTDHHGGQANFPHINPPFVQKISGTAFAGKLNNCV